MSNDANNPTRDRVLADTGWGIKPDDQPANASEAGPNAQPVYRYDPSEPDLVKKILRAQRRSFNTANKARIEPGRTIIYDINKDGFIIEGLSYGDANLLELLQGLGAAFDPVQLKSLGREESMPREYPLSRAWAWGAERSGG